MPSYRQATASKHTNSLQNYKIYLKKKTANMAIVRVALFIFILAASVALAFDPCAEGGGEFRRSYDCASVVQKHNVCCWKRRDGAHGILPKGCCTTNKGWDTNNCELLISEACETHHEDL